MPTYCVNKDAQSNGDHEVHDLTAGCAYEPAPANQIALGSHASCQSAVRAASSYYRQVNGCYYCARACHTG